METQIQTQILLNLSSFFFFDFGAFGVVILYKSIMASSGEKETHFMGEQQYDVHIPMSKANLYYYPISTPKSVVSS